MDFLPTDLLDAVRRFTQPRRQGAEELVRDQLKWAVAIALVPVPLVDVAALTALQLQLIRRLAKYYQVPYSEQQGRALLHAAAAATVATAGAGAVKAIPVLGTVVGGLTMAALAGGSTYAVGQVCIEHFEKGGTLEDLAPDAALAYYQKAFQKGIEFTQGLLKARDIGNEIIHAFSGTPPTGKRKQPTKPAPRHHTPTPNSAVFDQLKALNQRLRKGEVDREAYAKQKTELLGQLDANRPPRNGA